MKFRLLLIPALVFLFHINASAQYDFKKTDRWLSDHQAEIGGRALLVVFKDGHIVYNHAVNNMNLRQKMIIRFLARKQGKTADLSDYTAASRQPIASSSKWLSAALVMTFVDEGKLSLTDTVGKYLPVLSKHGKGKITISQCLSHMTGIKTPPLKENLEDIKNAGSMDAAIEDLAALPVEGEPGKVFHYSNAGLQIAGAVIEKISGQSFESLFAERIAKPLNMKNTDFGKGKVALPAGGAISTAEDYINFLTMILNGGSFEGKRILTQNSITQMQINRITSDVRVAYTPAEAAGTGYGFGEWIMKDPAAGKTGQYISSPGLFGSFPWIDQNKGYVAFLMTFYLDNDGRQKRYAELKSLVDQALSL